MGGSTGARRGAPRQASARLTSQHEPPPAPDDRPADPASVARSIALGLLTAAPRTRAELAEAMSRRRVPDDVAAAVLDRFGEVGLIDDAAFATSWVRSRRAGRGLAPRALASELRKKGVAEPLIAEAVDAVDRDDVESTARTLARRRAKATVGLPTQVRVRRLSGMLARKGYPGDVALRAVRDVLAEEQIDVAGELGRDIADQIAADTSGV
jgi:regulatory protein